MVVADVEVPADIAGPARRAQRAARNKSTRHVPLYFTRPENEEEALERRRIPEEAPEAIDEARAPLGLTREEFVYYVLSAEPAAEDLGAAPRTALGEADAVFSVRPQSKAGLAVFVRADIGRREALYEGHDLEEVVAQLVAGCYRRASWHIRGTHGMLKKNKKLKSLDTWEDCTIYARDLVVSGKPW